MAQKKRASSTEQAQKRLDSLSRQLQPQHKHSSEGGAAQSNAFPVVIGACICDIQAQAIGREIEAGGTVPGTVKQTLGGVGRNVAQALAQLCRGWQKVFLISILGDDVGGEAVLKHWQSLDLPCKGLVKRPTLSTPSVVYCLNQDGSVAAGVAALSAFEAEFSPEIVCQFSSELEHAPLLILDGNLPTHVLQEAASLAGQGNGRLWFEPVSSAKAVRATGILHMLDFVSPNASELVAMANAVNGKAAAVIQEEQRQVQKDSPIEVKLQHLLPYAQILLQEAALKAGVKHVVVTLGVDGAALYHGTSSGACQIHHMPALPAKVRNTNGAGDCLVAGACMRLLQGATAVAALAFGVAAAQIAVQSEENVPLELTYERIAAPASTVLKAAKSW